MSAAARKRGARDRSLWTALLARFTVKVAEYTQLIAIQIRDPWVFKGTRLPVATVIENLEDLSIDEVIEQFDVTREQVTAVLEFVAESLRSEVPTGARPV